jgi:hypothetical protein
MMPVAEGYSPQIERGPFWADKGGKVIIDSLSPGRHRFVINQEWPVPTFVDITVPPDGWSTKAIIQPRESAVPRPDLNVNVALRTKHGSKYPSLLDVTIRNNTDPAYQLSAIDPLLLAVDYRVFPSGNSNTEVVPPKGRGVLAMTLDRDEYFRKELWCSRRGEDTEWPGPVEGKDVLYFRVGAANCYSIPVPLPIPSKMKDVRKR